MLGPEGAALLTSAWLESNLERHVLLERARLGLVDPADLPMPDTFEAFDKVQLGVEEWPAVFTVAQNLRTMRLVDVLDAGAELYACTYSLRVYLWVRGDDEERTDLVRKRLLLAARRCLLERRSLTPPPPAGGSYTGSPIAVLPATIRESYSPDAVVAEDGATLAGAWLELDVMLSEVLEGPPALGLLESTLVSAASDTGALPPHPSEL